MAGEKTRERLFNNAVEKLIAKIPEGLSDLEKARYVYLELGKLFSFDERYWFGTGDTRNRMHRRAECVPIDFEELQENQKRKAICVSIAGTYMSVLEQIGIKSHDNYDYDHRYVVLHIGDKRYAADLDKDLRFIQLHLPTKNFGKIDYNIIDSIELEKIDEKLGYFYTGEKQFIDVINKTAEKNENETKLSKKVENIFNASKQIDGIDDLEIVERNLVYDFLFKRILNGKEYNQITSNKEQNYDTASNGERINYNTAFKVIDFGKNGQANINTYFMYDKAKKIWIKMNSDEYKNFKNRHQSDEDTIDLEDISSEDNSSNSRDERE